MSTVNSYVNGVIVSKAQSSANNWVNLGTVAGVGNFATIGINITNTSSTNNVSLNLAISESNSSPNLQDMIEYNLVLNPGGVLERSKIIANVGESVLIQGSTNDLACRLYGITQYTFNDGTVALVSGPGGGTVSYIQNQQGGLKVCQLSFSNYINNTANSQTINLPISYQFTPAAFNDIMGLDVQVSTTQVIIDTPNNDTPYNGNVLITGI